MKKKMLILLGCLTALSFTGCSAGSGIIVASYTDSYDTDRNTYHKYDFYANKTFIFQTIKFYPEETVLSQFKGTYDGSVTSAGEATISTKYKYNSTTEKWMEYTEDSYPVTVYKYSSNRNPVSEGVLKTWKYTIDWKVYDDSLAFVDGSIYYSHRDAVVTKK